MTSRRDLQTRWPWRWRRLASVGGENGTPRELGAAQLEVAVLDRSRKGRAFRRIAGAALTTLLGGGSDTPEKELGDAGAVAAPPAPGRGKPTVSAASVDLEGKPEPDPAEADDTNGDGS